MEPTKLKSLPEDTASPLKMRVGKQVKMDANVLELDKTRTNAPEFVTN